MGLFEKDIPEEVLKCVPILYAELRERNPYFGWRGGVYWYFIATWQSLVSFFVVYLQVPGNLLSIAPVASYSIWSAGSGWETNDIYLYGHLMLTALYVIYLLTYFLTHFDKDDYFKFDLHVEFSLNDSHTSHICPCRTCFVFCMGDIRFFLSVVSRCVFFLLDWHSPVGIHQILRRIALECRIMHSSGTDL